MPASNNFLAENEHHNDRSFREVFLKTFLSGPFPAFKIFLFVWIIFIAINHIEN